MNIKRYQINAADTAENGLALPSGFVLEFHATYKENDCWKCVFRTTVSDGGAECSHPEDMPGGRLEYPYSPATNNGNSETYLFSNKVEIDLDTHFGSGNWNEL